MTALEDRMKVVHAIDQAHSAGCRLKPACSCAGIDLRTLQRWRQLDGTVRSDGRPEAIHPRPSHALSDQEREEILKVVNQPRFAELPPSQIVPKLADEGIYLASESSIHRVLCQSNQNQHRGRSKPACTGRVATTHTAHCPGEVWVWDVTWLTSRVLGRWFYLYMILDLYSRKIVGYVVHETESSEHAAALVRRTSVSERIDESLVKPVLHGDNGAILKATTVLAMLQWLGISPSYSRPRVSNDNAFAESWFRTIKYHTGYPMRGFESLEHSRQWADRLVSWYNREHRHSGLQFVTPEERHTGKQLQILKAREAVYVAARERNPARWSRGTRNWKPTGAVQLNPDREDLNRTAKNQSKRQLVA